MELIDYARFCQLTYQETSEQGESEYQRWVDPLLRSMGCTKVDFLDRAGTQGFVVEIPGEGTLIAFRGTELMSIYDIRRDLSAGWHSIQPDGLRKVHRGFWEATRHVSVLVEGFVGSANVIHVTGHSLGGAVATVCADRLSWIGKTPNYLVTFGSPRVGNLAFKRHIERIMVVRRIVNGIDPIPYYGRGRHVGSLVFMDEHERMHESPDPWHTWLSIVRLWFRAVRSWTFCRSRITSHRIGRYVRALQRRQR